MQRGFAAGHTERERERERGERERQKQRERETHTHTQRQRKTDRQTETERESFHCCEQSHKIFTAQLLKREESQAGNRTEVLLHISLTHYR